MKKIIIVIGIITLLINPYGYAQVHFEQGESWRQILAKAKVENKYIFVDCYATWCGPCKQMDKEVYADTAVGKFLNPLFISVKMQMDTSKNDEAAIQENYVEAHQIMAANNVTAYPTLLFFSPDGKLVHKVIGYQSNVRFLREALNSMYYGEGEYSMLEHYIKGELPDSEIPRLVDGLNRAGDKSTASKIAQKYIHEYLLKLPEPLLLSPANINLMYKYNNASNDPVFDLFYKHTDQINTVMKTQDYAEIHVLNIIMHEELVTRLWHDTHYKDPIVKMPDWQALSDIVKNKYNQTYADRSIQFEKILFYKKTQQWSELIAIDLEKIEKEDTDNNGDLLADKMNDVNDLLYDPFFMHSNDKTVLQKALRWEKIIIDHNSNDPTSLDTYANLLYKIGKKNEAILFETKAAEIERANAAQLKAKPDPVFQETINKMKTNQPTWAEN